MKQVRCKSCSDYVEASESHCPYCGEPMNAMSRFSKKVTTDIHKAHLEHEGEHEHHRGHEFNQAENYDREPAQKSASTFDLSDLEDIVKKFTGNKSDKSNKKRGLFGTLFLIYIVFNIIFSIFRGIIDF